MKKIKILNSNSLKILAMILMLLDHLWATIVPGNQWMTNIGRMAFPIFAFLIVFDFVNNIFSDYAIVKQICIIGFDVVFYGLGNF